MKKEIIVLADLGHVKAYQVLRPPVEDGTTLRVELVRSLDTIGSHGKVSEKLSDASGRFASSDSAYGSRRSGNGERHEMDLEAERRLIRVIASNIKDVLLDGEGCAAWHFATHGSINKRVLACLPPKVIQRLRKNIKADLVKLSKAEIMDKFSLMEKTT